MRKWRRFKAFCCTTRPQRINFCEISVEFSVKSPDLSQLCPNVVVAPFIPEGLVDITRRRSLHIGFPYLYGYQILLQSSETPEHCEVHGSWCVQFSINLQKVRTIWLVATWMILSGMSHHWICLALLHTSHSISAARLFQCRHLVWEVKAGCWSGRGAIWCFIGGITSKTE